MRIQSISIENITSLKGKHFIDFNKGLQGEELFAITGPTGAGKSSLLSAISLALYGKTYKFGSLASNDFVTTGEAFGAVSLFFSLAGKSYQANWNIKILKRNGELIKNPKPNRELICEGVALEHVSITDILGLDFDQFCKTIILNQGEFAKFLHSSFKERKDIIEKLYRTQELSKITKNLKEKVKEEENEYKLKSLNYEKSLPFTDEEITLIKDDLIEKQDLLKVHDGLNLNLEPAFSSLGHLFTKLKEETDYKNKRELAKARLSEFIDGWNQVKITLSASKKAYDDIKLKNQTEVPKLREAIEHKTNLDHARRQLIEFEKENLIKKEKAHELSELTKSKKHSLELDQQGLREILSSYKLKGLFLNKSKNEIYSFKEDIGKLNNQINEKQRITSQTEILGRQIEQQNKIAANQLKNLKGIENQLDVPLDSVESMILNLRRKREAGQSLWNKLENTSEKLKEAYTSISLLKDQQEDFALKIKNLSASLASASKTREDQELAKAILKCHDKALVEQECPVCRSSDLSSLVLPILENSLSDLDYDALKQETNKNIYNHDEVIKRQTSFRNDSTNLILDLNKTKSSLFENLSEPLNWTQASDIDQGMKILKELFLNQQDQELKKQERLQELKTQLEQSKKEMQNSDLITKDLQLNLKEITLILEKCQYLIDQFVNNWKDLIKETINPEEIVKNFQMDHDFFVKQIQIEQSINSLTEGLESLKKQSDEISERLVFINDSSTSLSNDISVYEKKLTLLCKDKNPIERLEEIEVAEKTALKTFQKADEEFNKIERAKASEEQSIRIFSEQIEDLQLLQKTYIKKLAQNFKELSEYKEKIPAEYPLRDFYLDIIKESEKWLDLDPATAPSELLPILETRLETTWVLLMDQIKDVTLDLKTSVNTNIKRIEDYNLKLKGRKGLEEELEFAKNSLQLKMRLLEVFGKDEFRSYALGLLEQELVQGANLELDALCDGRYQLDLLPGKGGAMDFFVLDQWRESTLRKISTLSGGETFLVSLAMALALAELTRGQNEIDSFFIDEGFGHLDIDSIDEVLEVLMNIQNRGKQIGIISHVKALTDRIPVNLTLEKSSLGESKAEFIYN